MRTVAVTGASSQLGVFLLPRLQASEFRVDAYGRSAPSSPVETSRQVRWLRPRDDSGLLGADALVSCGPLSLAVAMVANTDGLRQVVAFSTTSVLTKAGSPNRSESGQMAAILADEDRLKSVCSKRGVGLLLLRPTLIYGCGLDRNISLLARIGKRSGFIPVAGNAGGLRQPVHADDLAALAVGALVAGEKIDTESPACGGTTLSYRAMVTEIAGCFSGVRAVRLPTGLLLAATGLASLFPAFRGVNTEMVRRQAVDLVFDDSPLRSALSYAPRAFKPVAADFEIPPEARALQLA